MLKQRSGEGRIEIMTTTTEVEGNRDYCMANVGPDTAHYQSCGEYLRKRNNGSTYCPVHGPMH